MRFPLEIIAQIVEQVDLLGDLKDTLALRFVSRMMNEEVLRVLMSSKEIYPANTRKLLELNRVELRPQLATHQVVHWRKRHAPSNDDTGLPYPKRGRTCIIGGYVGFTFRTVNVEVRPLPVDLLQPYLIARMESAEQSPCLLSALIDNSVSLLMGECTGTNVLSRRELFKDMVAAFNTKLIEPLFATEIFSTLFDSHGLDYWMPFYKDARLTIYPNPEHSLRLFYLLRLAQMGEDRWKNCEVYDWAEQGDEEHRSHWLVISLLEEPPKGLEYARLFAIDALNIVTRSKDPELMFAYLASNASRYLGGLSAAEKIWCAVKQGKSNLADVLIMKALARNDIPVELAEKIASKADSIIDGIVKGGENTHFGRSVIEEILGCKDIESVKELHQDMCLED